MLDTECTHLVAPKSLLLSQEGGISTACSVLSGCTCQQQCQQDMKHSSAAMTSCAQPSLSGEMADEMVPLQLHHVLSTLPGAEIAASDS